MGQLRNNLKVTRHKHLTTGLTGVTMLTFRRGRVAGSRKAWGEGAPPCLLCPDAHCLLDPPPTQSLSFQTDRLSSPDSCWWILVPGPDTGRVPTWRSGGQGPSGAFEGSSKKVYIMLYNCIDTKTKSSKEKKKLPPLFILLTFPAFQLCFPLFSYNPSFFQNASVISGT